MLLRWSSNDTLLSENITFGLNDFEGGFTLAGSLVQMGLNHPNDYCSRNQLGWCSDDPHFLSRLDHSRARVADRRDSVR
jgi:hypothetical protein